MKLHGAITINGKTYARGTEVPWFKIYPFFLLHMLVFGAVGFYLAYGDPHAPPFFLYVHGGFAVAIYTALYLTIFGLDEVKWMFINAALGLAGIYTQMGWLLSLFHKRVGDYPFRVHIIPGLYFVLYTFLLRHAITDLTGSREDPDRKQKVEKGYVALAVALYAISYYFGK